MFKRDQRGVIDPIFVIVLVLVLAVGGFLYWRTSTAPTEPQAPEGTTGIAQKENSVPEGLLEYRNDDLGVKFTYPEEWGEASYARAALNNEVYETNLPHTIKFSNFSKPEDNQSEGYVRYEGFTVRIVPKDWQFKPPGPSEWSTPLTLEIVGEKLIAEEKTNADYFYSSFGGELMIWAVKMIDIPKANADSVEYRYSVPGPEDGVDNSCIGSDQEAAESCFEDNILVDVKDSINSFTTIQ